jgi:hypothetical protein
MASSRRQEEMRVSSQAAQERVRRRLALKPHPGVHRDEIIRSGYDRIEVDLGDLGMVRCQLREPDQGLLQAGQIDRRLAAVPLQQRGGPRSSHQLGGIDVREGCEPGGTVGQDVGRHTAESEDHERPEDRFLDHSSEHFDARCGHRLHDDTAQPITEAFDHRLKASTHLALG